MNKPPFWKEEINYLENTLKAIDKRIAGLKQNVEKERNWALELKKQYIHDLREFDEAEFVDNYSKLNELLDFTDEQIHHTKRLEEIRNKPYFGRIDFLVNGDDEQMKLYIGLMSIDCDNQLYVIDWRAPVSELFYEAGKGKASYEAPDGKIEGEITLKRQYDIEEAKLVDAYDVDVNIFDEFLQKVLAKAKKGENLQNIASTIQSEQNEIIRNLKDDVIVVQGYAGCGKTTIALHRVAYALYRLPNLKSANVLLFSPNDAFLSYISKVLPELGEENTRSATFPKFVRRFLKTSQAVESSDEFVLRYISLDEKSKNIVNEKLSFSMREKMSNWLQNLNENLKFVTPFLVEGQTTEIEELNNLLSGDFKHAKYKEKVLLATDFLCSKYGIEGIEKRDLLFEQISQKLSSPVELSSLYSKFLEDFKFKPLDVDEKIPFEDAVLMCVLKELCQNVVLKMDVKHIVLDEAQDYPLLFVDFLLRIFKHATFSIFGDINQKTVAGELDSLEDIAKLEVCAERSKFVVLDKTYRSSEEIVEYSSAILGSPRHSAFRLKNGQKVDEIQIANSVEEISRQILSILEPIMAQNKSIGIVTGDTKTAREIFEYLSKFVPETNISFVKNAYVPAGTQIQIVPVSLCKGLEFDTVVVAEKGQLFETDNSSKFLFIATTRAINKLVVLKK